MSGCGCIYIREEFDKPTKEEHVLITATCEMTCCECGKTIMPGEVYEFNLWADRRNPKLFTEPAWIQWDTFHICQDCIDLRGHFYCGSWFLGMIIDDIVDWLNEGGEAICCYDGLTQGAMRVMEEVVWPRLTPPDDDEEDMAA